MVTGVHYGKITLWLAFMFDFPFTFFEGSLTQLLVCSPSIKTILHNAIFECELMFRMDLKQWGSNIDNWGGGGGRGNIHIFVFCITNFF